MYSLWERPQEHTAARKWLSASHFTTGRMGFIVVFPASGCEWASRAALVFLPLRISFLWDIARMASHTVGHYGWVLFSGFSRCLFADEGTISADPGGTGLYVKIEDDAMESYLNTTASTSDAPFSTELWSEILSWLGFLISDNNDKVIISSVLTGIIVGQCSVPINSSSSLQKLLCSCCYCPSHRRKKAEGACWLDTSQFP